MSTWVDDKLREKTRRIFESKYQRKLSDEEVNQIAYNLADFMEIYIKFKIEKNENEKLCKKQA